MRIRVLALSLLLFAAACAASAGGGGGGGGGGNLNLLTTADLEAGAISPREPLYEMIERLRPQWFQVRRSTPNPIVFIDGRASGRVGQLGTTALRTVSIGSVLEVRYHPPEAAGLRFPGAIEGAAIEVMLRE